MPASTTSTVILAFSLNLFATTLPPMPAILVSEPEIETVTVTDVRLSTEHEPFPMMTQASKGLMTRYVYVH